MTQQALLLKEVWVPAESPFRFREQVNPKTGEKRYILSGLMLPFNKVSRNNVLYNKESIMEKHKQLIGKPVMYNHKIDTDMLPKGHFIDSWVEDDGWYYKADIDPAEKDLIRKLERGDLRHVSIQLVGAKVEERRDDNGRVYTEAWVEDVIEGSIVPAPGFLDTTANFMEMIRGIRMKEDVDTTTGGGAIQPTQPLDDKEKKQEQQMINEFPYEDFTHGLEIELQEHGDLDVFEVAKLVIDHLKEDRDYYSKKEAESIVKEVGEKEVESILKEYRYKVGDPVQVPFGTNGKLGKYQGQYGLVVDIDEKDYTLLFSDGNRVKIPRATVEISAV